MPAHAAVSIDDDLAPGQPRVALRPANDKTPVGLIRNSVSSVSISAGSSCLMISSMKKAADFRMLHIGRVLGGDDHVRDRTGLPSS